MSEDRSKYAMALVQGWSENEKRTCKVI